MASTAADGANGVTPSSETWAGLGAPAAEVQLRFTLPTGQSFRWRPTGPDEFTGVIGRRVYKLRQEADDIVYTVLARGDGAAPGGDAAVLRDYFNLETSLVPLAEAWASADKRFRAVTPYIPGARVLRQDPVETVFEFICSSNNHISRIHGMVERLCRDFGTPLQSLPVAAGDGEAAAPDLAFYAFPTLEQLSAATEPHLRAEGFGYRAKFITGSVAQLLAKPGGGAAWLQGLRQASYPEAVEALCTLPGIGPKVAACVCLFALDKHAAIPVDTHVWQLACRHYTPHLRNKTLNKQVMEQVEAAFVERFGAYAGWAHNTLFIAELASQQEHLPDHLRSGGSRKAPAKPKAAAKRATKSAAARTDAEQAETVAADASAPVESQTSPAPPATPAARARWSASSRLRAAVKAEPAASGSPTAEKTVMDTASSSGRVLELPAETAAALKAEVDAMSTAAPGPGAQMTPRKGRGRRAPAAAQMPDTSEAAAGEPDEPAGPLTPAQQQRGGRGGAGSARPGGGSCSGARPGSKAAVQAAVGGDAEDVAADEAVQTVQAPQRRRVRARRG